MTGFVFAIDPDSRCMKKKPVSKPPYSVRNSSIHGRGVFATRTIRKGARIVEYRGVRTTMKEERDKPVDDPSNPFHTFLFEMSDGITINAGIRGNAARWINHSCAPNCEAVEEDDRVFIFARRRIEEGEELTYDYGLSVPGRITAKVKRDYECRCEARKCRGTMLTASG